MTRRWQVVPPPATRHPDDAVSTIAFDDATAPRMETVQAGVVRVSEGEGGPRPRTAALVGPPRPAPDGTRLVEVVVDGWRFELAVEDADRAELRRRATRDRDASIASGPLEIRAMIPGRVAALRVTVGDTVEAGAALLVVEAMKMQNELRASRAGTVERVAVAAGETIELGDLLVVLA